MLIYINPVVKKLKIPSQVVGVAFMLSLRIKHETHSINRRNYLYLQVHTLCMCVCDIIYKPVERVGVAICGRLGRTGLGVV